MNVTDDRELERYLKRQDALSRAYAELKAERPSPVLDQAILKQAHDALRDLPRARRMHFRGWPALAAIAATVVLSFALVMRVVLEPEMQRDHGQVAPAPAAQSPGDAAASKAVADQNASPAEPSAAIATPPMPAPAPSSIEERRSKIEAEIRATAIQAPAVTGSVTAVESDVPAAARAEETLEPSRADEAAPFSAPAAAESPAKKQQVKAPREWLQEIERLRAAGEIEAADRELERFRQAYPGYLEQQASPAAR